jgi:hypothetical protein
VVRGTSLVLVVLKKLSLTKMGPWKHGMGKARGVVRWNRRRRKRRWMRRR